MEERLEERSVGGRGVRLLGVDLGRNASSLVSGTWKVKGGTRWAGDRCAMAKDASEARDGGDAKAKALREMEQEMSWLAQERYPAKCCHQDTKASAEESIVFQVKQPMTS